MGRSPDGEPNDIEFLDAGVAPRTELNRFASYRSQRWIAFLLTLLLVALVLGSIAQRHSKPSASRPSGSPTVSARPSESPSSSPPSSTTAPVRETEVGAPLLGVRASWELFGRGDGVLVRIRFAAGRITTTEIPDLIGNAPVSFLVGTQSSLIRPASGGPSYVIADGRRPRVLAMADYAGPAFPGPDADDVWLPSLDLLQQRMELVRLDGHTTGVSLTVPEGSSVKQASSDDTGYLIFAGLSGSFDVRPGILRRITTGTVLAVGPTRWLVRECDDRDRCSTVVINRKTGARRVLSSISSDATSAPIGTISPDGTTAALIDPNIETEDVHLRNLITGVDHRVRLRTDLSTALNVGSMVWSPDSRWLFVAAAHGRLAAVDNRTGSILRLGTPLPELSQLAIRDR